VDGLNGVWAVARLSGALPPLAGVRKRIDGHRGVTALGPLPVLRFDVVGATLRYRGLLRGLVDELEVVDGRDEILGTTTFRGRRLGRFRMRRLLRPPADTGSAV
jgi:hypothetical protein